MFTICFCYNQKILKILALDEVIVAIIEMEQNIICNYMKLHSKIYFNDV